MKKLMAIVFLIMSTTSVYAQDGFTHSAEEIRLGKNAAYCVGMTQAAIKVSESDALIKSVDTKINSKESSRVLYVLRTFAYNYLSKEEANQIIDKSTDYNEQLLYKKEMDSGFESNFRKCGNFYSEIDSRTK